MSTEDCPGGVCAWPRATQVGNNQPNVGNNATPRQGQGGRDRNNRRGGRPTFKGAIESLTTLGTKSEVRQKDQFVTFQKSLTHYVMTKFQHPSDIVPAVRDLTDPERLLMQEIPVKERSEEYDDLQEETLDDPGFEGISFAEVPDVVESTRTESEESKRQSERQQRLDIMQEGLDKLFVEEMKIFANRRNILKQNLTKLYGVVIGQCTQSLQAEVAGDDNCAIKSRKYDSVWLLKKLKNLSAGFNKSVSPFQSLVNSLVGFYTLRQYREESIEDYRQRFEAAWNTVSMNKGSLHSHPVFNKHIQSLDSNMTDKDINNKLASVFFITFSDPNRFGTLWQQLSNAILLGRDEYPENLVGAYDLLSHFQTTNKQSGPRLPANVTFTQVLEQAQRQDPVAGTDDQTYSSTLCYKFHRMGHRANVCPSPTRAGPFQGFQHVFFTHIDDDDDRVPQDWLLLDSGSTISSICNPDLIHSIQDTYPPVTVYTNGGS